MLFFAKDLFWKAEDVEGSKSIIRILKIARTLKLYKDSYDVNYEGETDDEEYMCNGTDNDDEVIPLYTGDYAPPRDKRKKKASTSIARLNLLDSSCLSSNHIASHSNSELTGCSNRSINKRPSSSQEDEDEIIDYMENVHDSIGDNQPSEYIRL